MLVPCVVSARERGSLRVVFRSPRGQESGKRRAVMLLHLRAKAPEQVRVNGREAGLVSRAQGWAALALPQGVRWERLTLEPGDPFDGCNDAATAPYVVLEPDAPQK